jgi:uncharacterized tellurite resistance protein B-like protein
VIGKLKGLLRAGREAEEAESGFPEEQRAVAALLLEAGATDGHLDREERSRIVVLLNRRFGLSAVDAESLAAEAEETLAETHQLVGFTKAVKEAFDHDERIELLEMLWDVVYADGRLHDYEANLMRRLAGLLHVPDRESGAARKRALAKSGRAED